MKTKKSVLMLDENQQPYIFISRRKALKLAFLGKGEFIEERVLQVRFSILPFYRFYSGFSRFKVFLRDNNTCQYCGNTFAGRTIDHILPKSRGGLDSWDNCVTACKVCNCKKGDSTPEEANMRLLNPPARLNFIRYFK